MGGNGNHGGNRLGALGGGHALAGQDQRSRTIRDRAGGGGGNRAVLGEGGLEGRDLVRAALAGLLVGIDHGLTSPRNDRYGHDLACKGALSDGHLGAAERFNRIGVLRFAGQLIGIGGVLGESAHGAAGFVGVFQAIEEHMIIGGIVADPRAERCFLRM